MPFLVRYPKEIPANSLCTNIACNVDFAPTFLDFAGETIPTYMQGRSLRPLLNGQAPKLAEYCLSQILDAPRSRYNAYAHYGIRNQRYKLIYWYNEGFDPPAQTKAEKIKNGSYLIARKTQELFNLYNDPAYKDVVAMMTQALSEKMAEIGDIPMH